MVPGRGAGAGADGGSEAADVGSSRGAALVHRTGTGPPSILLAPVRSRLLRQPSLLPPQPPQPRGAQRRPGAGETPPSRMSTSSHMLHTAGVPN